MPHETTILVVDDDDDIRKLVRTSVQRAHRVIHEATTAREGIQLAMDTLPDILLLDIGLLGESSGFSLCEAIDDEPALWNVKTVIISGRDSDADILEAKRFGVHTYLIKPFSPRLLMELVERLEPKRHEMQVVPATQSVS